MLIECQYDCWVYLIDTLPIQITAVLFTDRQPGSESGKIVCAKSEATKY
jgi:hypothetical protein